MPAQIFNAVIGTAGHIDHGKSTLVEALTGIHPDRLKEEQERGITIDLGFAPMTLSNGMRAGIIDVPGHERFIKNMVAGAAGIDFVIMVIAADDGVMAQTREHLQIVQLLGVRDGLTVVTKKDLVDSDYLELVIEDIKTLEAGTLLENKPIIPVSSKTGAGIDDLRKALDAALPKLSRRTESGPFRMPIQRVFAKEGFGTVVTGVPVSGKVAVGDNLEVLPPGYTGRVKGLHAYKATISQGQAGHSTAVNLHGPGIDKQQVIRGMIAVTPDVFQKTRLVTAEFHLLPGTPWNMKHRAAVRFHSGTAEIQGKLLLLEGESLAPGSSAWVQILLEEDTVLIPGDRFILRLQTPLVTLGGGTIVDCVPKKRKRQTAGVVAELDKRKTVLGIRDDFIAHIVEFSAAPKRRAELCAETGTLPEDFLNVARKLTAASRIVELKPGESYISPKLLDSFSKLITSAVEKYIREHPALGAIERPELRRMFEKQAGREFGEHFDDVLAVLKQKQAVVVESNNVSLSGRSRKLEGVIAQQAAQVEALFKEGALAPPSPLDVEAQLRLAPKTFREILKYLRDGGALVEAAPEILFHRENFENAKAALRQLFASGSERTMSEIRQHLSMNRKYVVPLVELLDRQKFTAREGDKRRLI